MGGLIGVENMINTYTIPSGDSTTSRVKLFNIPQDRRCIAILNLFTYKNQGRCSVILDIIVDSGGAIINSKILCGSITNTSFAIKIWKVKENDGSCSIYVNTPYGEIISPQSNFIILLKGGNTAITNIIAKLPEGAEEITIS